jgi:hypothetical protein
VDFVGGYLVLNKSDKRALAVLQGRPRFLVILVILAICSRNGFVHEALRDLKDGMTKNARAFPTCIKSKSSLVHIVRAIEVGTTDFDVEVVRAIFRRMVITHWRVTKREAPWVLSI